MYNIKHVHISSEYASSGLAERAAAHFGKDRVTLFDTEPDLGPEPVSKEHLIITRNKGEFLKPCPCTSHYLGCGYHVLNYMHNCPLTCTYCILQAYLNRPAISLFANFEDIETELEAGVWNGGREVRIGTGELGDSLALESLSGFAGRLVELFGAREHSVLELKTKTVAVDSLLSLAHKGRTIIAWSVNTPWVIGREERDTAPLAERAKTAQRVIDAGYRVAFHCDPALIHPDWEKGYDEMIAVLADTVRSKDRVAWFSIGGMRFMPELKRVINRDHPEALAATGEFIEGLDGKQRYYRKVRTPLFKRIYEAAVRAFPQTAVYFCMESSRVWEDVTGRDPGSRGIAEMLDEAVFGGK